MLSPAHAAYRAGMAPMAEVHAAWQAALEQWAQAARHDTLLGLAAKHAQLAWLAGKYRDAAWSNPHDPIARDRLERVRRAAMIMTLSKVKPLEVARRPLRGVMVLLVGAMFATGLGLFITDYKIQQQQTMLSRHP